jgi:hypothetical protein
MGYTNRDTLSDRREGLDTLQDLTANHLPKFLRPLKPTPRAGTEALVAAARARLAP